MMKHFGKYTIEDEISLSDENNDTCADLLQIWSQGPASATYRTIWGMSSTFNVTLLMSDDLSLLLDTYKRDKVSMYVMVSKEEPFVGEQFGQVHGFSKCDRLFPWTFGCKCELSICSVFVTVTVKDRSIIPGNSSLKLCEIFIAAT